MRAGGTAPRGRRLIRGVAAILVVTFDGFLKATDRRAFLVVHQDRLARER